MKIAEFQSIIKKKFAGVVVGHFDKLVESHGFSEKDDVTLFFSSMEDDAFFNTTSMPSKWTIRTYSFAMESFINIFNDDDIKNVINTVDVARLIKIAEGAKRKYMTMYKSIRRKHKASKDKKDYVGNTAAQTQPHKDNEGAEVEGDGNDDEDDDSINLEIDLDGEIESRTNSDTSQNKEISMDAEGVPDGASDTESGEDDVPSKATSDISALCANDDLVCKHKLKKRISYITEMIDLFMRSEDDDKRKTILQVIKNEVVRLTGDE